MVRTVIQIIFVILNSYNFVLVESALPESNKISQREIYYVNCCELNGISNSSCIEENSPLLSVWEGKKWEVNERYSYTNIDSICSINSTLDINVSINDLTQFPIYDDYESESPQFITSQENVTKFFKNFLIHEERYYTADEYCVLKADSEYVELKLCKRNCQSEICIPKCCPLGQSLNVSDTFQCLDNGRDKGHFRPVIYPNDVSPDYQIESDNVKIQYYAFNYSCGQMVVSQNKKIETLTKKGYHGRIRLLRNGDLLVRTDTWNTFSITGKSTYCLESLHNDSEVLLAILCNQASLSDPRPIYRKFLTAINVVEGLFTLITTVVYLLLWKKLKNTHRLTQFFHITSYGLLSLVKVVVFSVHDSQRGHPICFILGLVTNYLILATGSWMVIINWDLFLMFWNMRQKNPEKSLKNLLPFCLYGFISPLIPIIIGLILQAQYENDNDTNIVIPEYGKYRCFTSRYAAYYYVFIPINLDYLIVVVLFLITSKVIYNHKQSTNLASASSTKHRRSESSKSKGRLSVNSILSLSPAYFDNFKLFSRLAALSGLFGLMDVLSLLPLDRRKWKFLYDIYAITEHILGFALFYLYVCNRSTLKDLKNFYQNAVINCRQRCHVKHHPQKSNEVQTDIES